MIYEDNRPCIDQISQGFIKGDRIKHIAPKLFLSMSNMEIKLTLSGFLQRTTEQTSLPNHCLPPYTKIMCMALA